MTNEQLRTTTAPGAQDELAKRNIELAKHNIDLTRRLEVLENRLTQALDDLARERQRVAQFQVKWVAQAVHGALAESSAYRHSRCSP